MIYLKTMLYEFEACMKYAILIKEKKKNLIIIQLDGCHGNKAICFLKFHCALVVRERYSVYVSPIF